MRFLFEEKLWLLIPWFAAAGLWRLCEGLAQRKLRRFASPEALGVLTLGPPGGAGRTRRRQFFWKWAAGALVIAALARPQLGSHMENAPSMGRDVVFVLDVSRSMLTEDVVPSRLKKAKHIIRGFLDRMGGDRVGVVLFAASAYPAVPMTTDFEFVKQTLEGVDDRSIPHQGSDLALGLEQALRLIRGGAVNEKPEASSSDGANRAVIVLSDGEDHEGSESRLAEALKGEGIRIYCIGVGTERGGPIPLRDENGYLSGYKKDASGNMIQSKLETKNLETIAKKTAGRYYTASANEGEIDDISESLGGTGGHSGAMRQVMVYDELFQFPLGLALCLLLAPALWNARKRRFGALACVGIASALALPSPGAQAAPLREYREYDETRKGLEAYSKKDFRGAVDRFTKAQAAGPDADVHHLNLGDSLLQANDLDGAAREFSKLLESPDPKAAARGALNLGKTFEKQNDFEKSVQAYQRGLDRIGSADPEAMLRLKQALEQSNRQKQKQQQGGQSQEDKGQSGQEKKEKEQGGGKDDKVDERSAGKKQKFKGEKLSEGDARQLLERLQDQEKKSQQRLMRAKMGKPKEGKNEKDW